MGFGFKSETVSGGAPVFQREYENAQGGFTVDITGLTAGVTIPAGSVMGFDEATRLAKPLKVAKLYENAAADAVVYKIEKGHLFKGGEKVAAVVGGKSYAISAIDTSNASYDAVTVATTLGALNKGTILFESTGNGATAGALAVTPKGLLYQEVKAEAYTSCAVVTRGTVYERRIPVVPTAVKALIPNIIFSQSY